MALVLVVDDEPDIRELTPKQRHLLEALSTRTPVTVVAQQLGISRSNVYASLRRIGRKLGLKGTNELLALLRQGALLDARSGPAGPPPSLLPPDMVALV